MILKFLQTTLVEKLHIYSSVSIMATECGKSDRHVVRALHALSEAATRAQSRVRDQVLSYVAVRKSTGLHCRLFLEHVQHDETQTVLVASYPGGEPHAHKGKVHIVQQSWAMLIEDDSGRFFTIQAEKSPAVRLSENATGETIASILRDITGLGSRMPSVDRHCAVVESDECSANSRALHILRHPSRPCLQGICAAHKCHTIADRCWQEFHALHAGVVRTLKVLKSPGMYPKFCDLLLRQLDSAELVTHCPLSEAAIGYRDKVLQVYSPTLFSKPKSASVIRVLTDVLFNGDWASPIIRHHCPGPHCCQNREHMVQRMKTWLPRLLRALRLSSFSAGDWSQWHASLDLLGFLSSLSRNVGEGNYGYASRGDTYKHYQHQQIPRAIREMAETSRATWRVMPK